LKYPSLNVKDFEEVQQIIEAGMPEKKKEKKTKNVVETKANGAEIFMPSKKRNKKPKYPKDYNVGGVNPAVDPERWLPKWQRSKYKRMARKRGVVLKGAQGDAAVDTDVSNFNKETSTVHKDVVETKKKQKKNRK